MDEKKPRWEVKFEQYKQEGTKYEEMKKHLKALKEGKVKGNFKTKQEYQDFVDEKAKQIAEYEKNIKGYEDFKKNEQKIQNILEYRNSLQEKLDNLPKDTTEDLINKRKEQAAKAQRIAQYQLEVEDLKQQLKKDLSDGDRQILLLTLKTRMDSMGVLQEEQANLDRELASLEETGKDFNEKIEIKKDAYERKIKKCNIIAKNLLKGKDLGEIELRVEKEGKRFTSPDGKLPEETKKARNEEKYSEIEDEVVKENNALTEVSDFATKYPILARIGNFFKNIGSRVSNLFKRNDLADRVEKINNEENDRDKKRDEYIEEIAENVKSRIEAQKSGGIEANVEDIEDELLKKIAEKGVEETFRERLAFNKKEAANNNAKDFGGKYEKQGGATEKFDPTSREQSLKKDDGR